MTQIQLKVIDWIRSGMIFSDGINLLMTDLNKRAIAMQYIGREKSMDGKVAYEVIKAAGLADHTNWKEFIVSIRGAGKVNVKNSKTTDTLKETDIPENIVGDGVEEYPPIIRRITVEYAEIFQERSRIHQAMTEMPESNSMAVCLKRAELCEMIRSLSLRLQQLYESKNDYELKGILPDESKLFPPDESEESKVDLTTLSEDSLKRMKKNLQSNNSKDKAILDPQMDPETGIKTAIPISPKRTKIEMRICRRNERIAMIEEQLLKYAVKKQ